MSPIPENAMRRRLAAGERAVGTMVAEFRQASVMQLLANAGMDFAIIDAEHGPFSVESIADLARAGVHAGVTPIVRVPELAYVPIATSLDAGAQGVMIPRVTGVDEAAEAVALVKYPPAGRRGTALSRGATRFRSGDLAATMAAANDETMVVIQIETVEALAAVDVIARTPGVDVLFVGPTDLSIALGVPGQTTSAAVEDAIEAVAAACRAAGVRSAVQMNDVGLAARWASRVDIISHSADAGFLQAAAAAAVAAIRSR